MHNFNTTRRGWNFLQTPGPTNIPTRILNAMHHPAVEFLGPEFMHLKYTQNPKTPKPLKYEIKNSIKT